MILSANPLVSQGHRPEGNMLHTAPSLISYPHHIDILRCAMHGASDPDTHMLDLHLTRTRLNRLQSATIQAH